MSKCLKCPASWTTPGMAMCPICGAKVGEPAASEPSQAKLEPEMAGVKGTSVSGTASARLSKSAILKSVSDGRPSTSASGPRHGSTTALPGAKALDPAPGKDIPKPAPELKVTTFPKPDPKPQEKPVMDDSPSDLPKADPPLRVSTRLVDASVALLSTGLPTEKDLPLPARPLSGPLILGLFAMVTVILLPITVAFESSRVLGIMGFCLSGFFVPFPPIAWIAGLAAEKRRREQGLCPERRVVLGRLLGQWGTLLLITEVTAVLILIAGLRLAGKLPPTFWNTTF